MIDDQQPNRSSLNRLTKHQIKRLMFHGLLDPHDGVTKFAGSRQDIYVDKDTGELWAAGKHNPSFFEPLYINPRERGLSGF